MLSEKTNTLHHYLTDVFGPLPDETELGEQGLYHGASVESAIGNILGQEGWKHLFLETNNDFADLKSCITTHIKNLLSSHQKVDSTFVLEDYHKHVQTDQIHYAVSSWAMSKEVIGKHFELIKKNIEDIVGANLATKEIEHKGTKGHFLGFRIVRPHTSDHNPYHRDAWLPYWRDTLNVWIPICGFENGNTISLLPGSHILDDSQILRTKRGAIIGEKKYHVPEAIATTQPFEKITPRIHEGEGLLFSPFLLHGNGKNKLPDTTRVSIELRFCKAK